MNKVRCGTHKYSTITFGKVYEIIDVDNVENAIWIVNDNGVEDWYLRCYFEPIVVKPVKTLIDLGFGRTNADYSTETIHMYEHPNLEFEIVFDIESKEYEVYTSENDFDFSVDLSVNIDMELHLAIHQELIRLGMIGEE